MYRRLCLLALAFTAAACSGEGAAATASATAAPPGTEVASAAAPTAAPFDPAIADACAARRAEIQKQEALPGSESLVEKAVHFARVRSRAALWRKEPALPFQLEKLARGKRSSVRLVRAVRDILNKKGPKADKRKAVLSDGYLFADDPLLALALSEQVSLTKLFEEKTLFLQRGVDLYELVYEAQTKLEKERYVYKGGAFDGEKAELLFGDRVATSREELESAPPLTIDLRDLMNRAEFDRIKPVHLTETALVAEVRYGEGTWVPAVFDIKGAKLDPSCEALTPELSAKKTKFVEETRTYRAAVGKVRATVRKMVREKLPFDAAPDQKNGFLRKAWKRAYLAGWRTYQFEGESHEVYTDGGAARPPEVCIDFLTDAWERASGTWYQAAEPGDPMQPNPKKTAGAIDFDSLGISNRRSVAEFTEFAEKNPKLFDVWEVPKDERIPFKERDAFFAYLGQNAEKFIAGDMITVHGFKEGGRPHYHSLIILELDPLTGVPTLVAGNAVVAREQSLEGVLQISPKRTLRHRIRVKEPWLSAVAASTSTL